jgi:hypothetical protein
MSKYFKKLNELDKKILYFESTPKENIKAFSFETASNKEVSAKKNKF